MNFTFWAIQTFLVFASIGRLIVGLDTEINNRADNTTLILVGTIELMCFTYLWRSEKRPTMVKAAFGCTLGVATLVTVVAVANGEPLIPWLIASFIWLLPTVSIIIASLNKNENFID